MRALLTAFALLLALPLAFHAEDERETSAPPALDYLVIGADGLMEAAREWAAYRASHGRVVRAVSLSDISAWAGVEKAGLNEIKNYVAEAAKGVDDLKDFQLLLLGDCPDEGSTSHDPQIEIPWFLTRQMDANANPDRRKRIPTDNFLADIVADDDNLPDIAVGRIPARSNEQAALALAKVKAYESAPEGEWLRNLTFFAGEGRFGAQVDALLESLFTRFAENTISQDYRLRMTYANINSSYAYIPRKFSDKVIEEANDGAFFLVYMGHGSHDRLDNMYVEAAGRRLRYPILSSDDAGRFAIPDGKLPVMLIIACQTGYMDHKQGSLAERICFTDDAPVAVIASSRDSHPYTNTLLQKALTGELTEHRRSTLGEAFLRAKRELVLAEDPDRSGLEVLAGFVIPNQADRAELNRSHLSLYNLTGDPGLRLRYPSLELKALGNARHDAEAGTVQVALNTPALEGLTLECHVEVRRTRIAGEIKPFNRADLASDDAEKVAAAEAVIAENHAISNNKRVASVKLEHVGTVEIPGVAAPEQHFEGKIDPALAPGDYLLKLSARNADGKSYGFASAAFTVKGK